MSYKVPLEDGPFSSTSMSRASQFDEENECQYFSEDEEMLKTYDPEAEMVARFKLDKVEEDRAFSHSDEVTFTE